MPTLTANRAETGDQALSVSRGLSVLVVSDANAASSWFQYDEIINDVDSDEVLASQQLNANQTVVADAEGVASAPTQSQGSSDTIVADADADGPILFASFKLISDINDDIDADSVISSQLAAIADTIVNDIESASLAVSQIMNANDTVVSDINAKADGEPGVFINNVDADNLIVQQRLRASVLVVSDADADAPIVSEDTSSFYSDVVVADANGDGSIQVNTLHAYQLIANDIDVAVELINDTSGVAWVFNAWTQAFSRYTGFDVNHAESIDGAPTFATPTGVYRFSSSSFADAKVKFGLSNFGAMQTKRLRAVYVTTVGDGVVNMATFHGYQGLLVQHNYATPSQSSDVPINRRLSPARGDQGQFWGLQFSLTGGTRQEVHNIRILPLVTGRNL